MKPAEIQILDLLDERLALMTKRNGYNVDLSVDPKRGKLTPETGKELPELHYWQVGHGTVQDAYGNDQHSLRVIIDVRDRTYEDSFSDVAANIIAEVMTVLNRSTTAPRPEDEASHDLGGVVADLSMFDAGYQIGEGAKPWVGALVEIVISYESDHGDMFNFQP